jgi:fused signal recognition particle receptor
MAFFKSFSNLTAKFKQGLAKTREILATDMGDLLKDRFLDEELIREIEVLLLRADIGVKTTSRLITQIREDHKTGKMVRGEDVLNYLKREMHALWPVEDRELRFAPAGSGPTVIMVTGVNGAGKTTSIAKLCHMLRQDGKSVLLAACDTFRAGAVRQLEIWAQRLGVDVVKGQQGGDPAAVAFDAAAAALARNVDVLIVDTAGRLHTQDPLMRQLTKIRTVLGKKIPGAPHEVLLVLDATSGQNALRQAEEFSKALAAESAAAAPAGSGPARGGLSPGPAAAVASPQAAQGITGIFLAKLDGTAKGGIVVAIKDTIDIPVKFVGVGETPEDIAPFNPEAFVEAMFART